MIGLANGGWAEAEWELRGVGSAWGPLTQLRQCEEATSLCCAAIGRLGSPSVSLLGLKYVTKLSPLYLR